MPLLFNAFVCAPGYAGPERTIDQQIAGLEARLFQHEYPSDTTDARLARLEKMVFGEEKTGEPSERLKGLTDAVPAPANDTQTAESQTPSSSGDDNTAANSASTASETDRTAGDAQDGSATPN